MNGPVLTLLAGIIAALMGLGALGAVWQGRARQFIGYGGTGLGGLAALLALVSLLSHEAPAMQALPLGLPGAAFRLVLDPLSAFFAALLFAAGAATCAFTAAADGAATDDPASAVIPGLGVAPLPVCVAGLGLAILAADGLSRATGLALAGGAIWVLAPADRASAAQLGVTLLAAASIIAAASVPPPALPWVTLLGPGALAALVPLHAWLTAEHPSVTPQAAALLSGSAVPVALYAMLRLLFDPVSAAPPAWWGLPLLIVGAASATVGGFDATRRGELDTALNAGTVRQSGLAAIGLGVALTARAADLPGVAAMALSAVLLLAALQALCGTLLPLVAGVIRKSADTRRLDRLGGLVHRMPITTGCFLAGMFGVSALPPGAGFAAIWLLFQALLALPHAGGIPFRLLLCAQAAVLGLTAALASASLLRLVGVVCLGRPRTPRAAAADEPPRPARRPLLALAAAAVVLGVFVGPFLRLAADAPVRALTGTGLGSHASLFGLAPGAESPGYAALPIAGVMLLVVGSVLWVRRLRGVPNSAISGPAWNDGFAAPPAWLPFGDPVTQSGGSGFAPPLTWPAWLPQPRLALTRHTSPPRQFGLLPRPALTTLRAPAVVLIVVATLLALCAWTGAT